MISMTLRRLAPIAATVAVVACFAGCAAKGPSPLQLSISLDDAIYAPGEQAILTVTVTNPDDSARAVAVPSPTNTRLYHSLVGADGIPMAKGQLPLLIDLVTEPVQQVGGGQSISTTLAVGSVGAEPGSYVVVATYRNESEPGAKATASNEVDILVE